MTAAPLLIRAGVLALAIVSELSFAGCKSSAASDRSPEGLVNPIFPDDGHGSLNGVLFLTGNWRSMNEAGLSEEIWSSPYADSMIGTFSMSDRSGALKMQEVLAIAAEPDGTFMRLRHFDAKMVSREEKDSPIVLKLDRAENSRAVFRCIFGSKSLATITYWRTHQVLHSEIAFTPESKRETLKFEMRLAGISRN